MEVLIQVHYIFIALLALRKENEIGCHIFVHLYMKIALNAPFVYILCCLEIAIVSIFKSRDFLFI